jgi:hypothetical protein
MGLTEAGDRYLRETPRCTRGKNVPPATRGFGDEDTLDGGSAGR